MSTTPNVYHVYYLIIFDIGIILYHFTLFHFSFLGHLKVFLVHVLACLTISTIKSIVLNSFYPFHSISFFIPWLFPGISGSLFGITDHFQYDIYCLEQFFPICIISLCVTFVSWLFLGIFGPLLALTTLSNMVSIVLNSFFVILHHFTSCHLCFLAVFMCFSCISLAFPFISSMKFTVLITFQAILYHFALCHFHFSAMSEHFSPIS